MKNHCHLEAADLQEYAKQVFGNSYSVTKVSKMEGGAQKVVYKLDCTGGFSCILYVWDLAMNYFREEIVTDQVHAQSYGSEYFELNNRYLIEHSIRTPLLYDMNRSRDQYDFDYALVEYIPGKAAEAYFEHPDPRVKEHIFQQIGELIRTMHRGESGTYGKPGQGLAASSQRPCHLNQLNNGIAQLSYAAEHHEVIRKNQGKLLDKLYELESRITPRRRYGFIHGELGPNHIMVTEEQLEPCLIDIEGSEFYDIEYEHSFLELRFGGFYRYLKNDRLDENRLRFYKFHHHLSLISGGLKLLQRGFPDQQLARAILDCHTEYALQYIEG
ncbi:phosphotransferase family protein [Paenibacillus piscarius]|uniref:phosphotransferase family protein n=1 Tax=Paenibacillus piscarius TaxID=1089681 RepID=UPI001EE94E5E|nr:phosphotransferase [Paenibacillus piscarius]